MGEKVEKCENGDNDQNMERKEKLVLSPKAYGASSVSSKGVDEEPQHYSDPDIVV